MNQVVFRGLRFIYRRVKSAAIVCFLFFIKKKNIFEWKKYNRNHDLSVLKGQIKINTVNPIHVEAWHRGSRFFKIFDGTKEYFVKATTDKRIGQREIDFYSELKKGEYSIQEFVPQNVCWIDDGDSIYIIMDYLGEESLSKKQLKTMNSLVKKNITEKLYAILVGLKEIGYAHNDIRLGNIMYTNERVYLYDFGYAAKAIYRYELLASLSTDERTLLNEFNRINENILCDSFSMFNVMKTINPELYHNQFEIWCEVNKMIKEELAQYDRQCK